MQKELTEFSICDLFDDFFTKCHQIDLTLTTNNYNYKQAFWHFILMYFNVIFWELLMPLLGEYSG